MTGYSTKPDLEELNAALLEVDGLADSYTVTVSEAEATLENASSSLDRTELFLRLIVVVAALAAVVVGWRFSTSIGS